MAATSQKVVYRQRWESHSSKNTGYGSDKHTGRRGRRGPRGHRGQLPEAESATVDLVWANAEQKFYPYDSSIKGCSRYDTSDDYGCDNTYPDDFTIVDKEGDNSSMTATLMKSGQHVTFYSTQPVFLVDPDYPASNTGIDLATSGPVTLSMGFALIPPDFRPIRSVTCVASALGTQTEGTLAKPPNNNLYTAEDSDYNKSPVITVYPDGNVWIVDTLYGGDANYVYEWACQWQTSKRSYSYGGSSSHSSYGNKNSYGGSSSHSSYGNKNSYGGSSSHSSYENKNSYGGSSSHSSYGNKDSYGRSYGK